MFPKCTRAAVLCGEGPLPSRCPGRHARSRIRHAARCTGPERLELQARPRTESASCYCVVIFGLDEHVVIGCVLRPDDTAAHVSPGLSWTRTDSVSGVGPAGFPSLLGMKRASTSLRSQHACSSHTHAHTHTHTQLQQVPEGSFQMSPLGEDLQAPGHLLPCPPVAPPPPPGETCAALGQGHPRPP